MNEFPVRDRIAVNLVWEAILAVVAGVLIVAMISLTTHHNLTSAMNSAGYLGLIAAGLAFSLRAGSPNLAVGAITGFSATLAAYLCTEHGWGKWLAVAAAVGAATLIGLVLGLLSGMLSVPAWATTLGAGFALQAGALGLANYRVINFPLSAKYPTALWLTLFLFISVGGGLLWLIPGLRRVLSAARLPGDPGRWAGMGPALSQTAGLAGSSLLAGLAAAPLLAYLGAAEPTEGPALTVPALAAVLIGGVSIFGRRAGIFGTALGVVILTVAQTLLTYNAVSSWVWMLLTGLAVLVGLVISRLLETITDAFGA